MKRVSEKIRHQFFIRSKKELRIRQKRNAYRKKHKRRIYPDTNHSRDLHKGSDFTSVVHAPANLSVLDNTTETLRFFNNVHKTIQSTNIRGKIFFDLSAVSYVTVDAIMYLIATVTNVRKIRALGINCFGNLPNDDTARRKFETCGFYSYVAPSYHLKNESSGNHINISRGCDADPILAGKICEFVHEHANSNRLKTKHLYTTIMELMTNTKQHAYKNTTKMICNWYVFVEDSNDFMKFVFLDTGAGIPNTVRTKGVVEKIKNLLSKDDAFFIASALRGEFRSETNLEYRGKGLPEVYKRVSCKEYADFAIVSGFGKCIIDDDKTIREEKMDEELIGTMLCWKLLKQ